MSLATTKHPTDALGTDGLRRDQQQPETTQNGIAEAILWFGLRMLFTNSLLGH